MNNFTLKYFRSRFFSAASLSLFVFFALFRFSVIAQNLVPNPSFEQYDTCPNAQDEIRYATGWYLALAGSANFNGDYYNACDTLQENFSVPYNAWGGYKPAATGNAYFGIFTYQTPYSNYSKEFFGTQLISPLTIGNKYFVSVKFKPEINIIWCTNYAMNHLGVLFSTANHKYNGYFDSTFANINYAHVYADSIIKDTVNWTTVSGFFTADSAYNYIIIGNFFDFAHRDSFVFSGSSPCGSNSYVSYYFVDDVMVTDSLTGIQNYSFQDYFSIYPNPFSLVAILKAKRAVNFKNAELKIFNSIGKEVKQKFIYSQETLIERDSLPQGMYLLKILIDDKIFFEKLIITN